jgi:hypothetical protein
MPIRSIAFIGKSSEPLFVYSVNTDTNGAVVLQEESIIHSAIDIFEEKRGKKLSASTTSTTDLYLGHILTISRSKLYGLSSNTNTKIVIVCDMDTDNDDGIKSVIQRAHKSFVNAIKNPFQDITSAMESKKFSSTIKNLISTFNDKF